MDGIYRVSGNLAVVQKLRFLVDRGETTWEEVHTASNTSEPRVVLSEGVGTACLSYWSLLYVAERAVTSDGRYMFPEQAGQGTYMGSSKKKKQLYTPINPPCP